MEAMERFRPQPPGQQEQKRREAAENALFRVDVRRSLRLHRRVAIATAATVFCALLALIVMSRKHYSAECVVTVMPSAQHVLADGIGSGWGADSLTYDTMMEQQIQLVRRYDVLAKALNAPGANFRLPKESEQAAVERLAKATTVTRVEKSYQMSIGVTARTGAQAAALANAITNGYLAASRADDVQAGQERIKALRTERAGLQAQLDSKIAQQSELLQRLRILPGSTAAYDSDFASLSGAAAQAKVKHDEALSHMRSLDIPGAEAAGPENTGFGAGSSLQQKRDTLVAQMAGLTPNHPIYKADQVELAQIDQQIAAAATTTRTAAVARAQSQARTELAAATALQASLTGQLAAEAAKASKNTPDIEQSNSLANEIQRLELRYGAVDDRIRNVELENGNSSQLALTSAARAPLQGNPNKRMLFLLLLFPAPIFAGIAAAVIALRIDPRIYSAADVEAITGYPPFAFLLHQRDASPQVIDEYLLRMAAGVESLHTTRGVKSILVSGNTSESGASSIVTALALKLQQVNRDSAVLDADADDVPLTQEDIRTLTQKHGLLLIDCAPILSSARSEYLARFTDAILLVTESGRTTRAELRRAIKLLEKIHAGGVAVVLNKVTLASAEDAVQREVAEVEQRLLGRSGEAYSRPALRLYNTQPQERLFDTIHQNPDGRSAETDILVADSDAESQSEQKVPDAKPIHADPPLTDPPLTDPAHADPALVDKLADTGGPGQAASHVKATSAPQHLPSAPAVPATGPAVAAPAEPLLAASQAKPAPVPVVQPSPITTKPAPQPQAAPAAASANLTPSAASPLGFPPSNGMNGRPPADAGLAGQAKDTVDSATWFEPAAPASDRPSAYETFIPLPSKGDAPPRQLRTAPMPPPAATAKPAPAAPRNGTGKWLNRAEIERSILGSPRRPDK